MQLLHYIVQKIMRRKRVCSFQFKTHWNNISDLWLIEFMAYRDEGPAVSHTLILSKYCLPVFMFKFDWTTCILPVSLNPGLKTTQHHLAKWELDLRRRSGPSGARPWRAADHKWATAEKAMRNHWPRFPQPSASCTGPHNGCIQLETGWQGCLVRW